MFSYLALGDSYTIGESVPIFETFPYQTVYLLREQGLPFTAPEIVAKTGWTSTELFNHLQLASLRPTYDVVSLLIGVNDQYRGESKKDYQIRFETLLAFSLKKVQLRADRVFVLSIPDWGQTPFAALKNPLEISRDIDAFNLINRTVSLQYGVSYIDITPSTRRAPAFPELVAADGLHPSGMEYGSWASQLAKEIGNRL